MSAREKMRKGSRGFTLIEIAIVVAIIGLLLLIALPLYTGARQRAYIAEARQLASEWKALAWSCLVENNFKESKCDGGAKIGWTASADSDAWQWTSGTVMACGATDTVVVSPPLSACAGATDGTAANSYYALQVTPVAGTGLTYDYVLVLRTNTGKVQESAATGVAVPTP